MESLSIRFKKDCYRQYGIVKDDDVFKHIPQEGEVEIVFNRKEIWSLVKFIKDSKIIKGYKPVVVNC